MPPTKDPSDLFENAADVIREEIGELLDAQDADALEDFQRLNRQLAFYWTLRSSGTTDALNEANRNLQFITSQARLIVARHALHSTRLSADTAEAIFAQMARIGAILLRGFIAP